MVALAKTFFADTPDVKVEVLTGPNPQGLCKVAYGAKIFVRHIDRLVPLNDAAKELFEKHVPLD